MGSDQPPALMGAVPEGVKLAEATALKAKPGLLAVQGMRIAGKPLMAWAGAWAKVKATLLP